MPLGPKVVLATLALVASSPAIAQSADWDGRWSGSTKGKSVVIVISGGAVQSYTFGGESFPVGSSQVEKGRVSFVAGTAAAVNSMTPAGRGKANWTFDHPRFGHATAMLTKG